MKQLSNFLGMMTLSMMLFVGQFGCTVDNVDDGGEDGGSGVCVDFDNDGFTAGGENCDGDCDDSDPYVNPEVVEICDGVDNDCNGLIDEDWPLLGNSCDTDDSDQCANGTYECSQDYLDMVCAGDVNMTEECDDNIDNDCDGDTDEGCGDCIDGDVDGYGTGPDCLGTDCNDGDPLIYQDAPERCDNKDNDCDGDTDEDFSDLGSDCDGDDEDECLNGLFACAANELGLSCIETVHTSETCDDLDNDCDGETDEDWPSKSDSCDGSDADECLNGSFVCSGDGSTVVCEEDLHLSETCGNSIDDDCDGDTDEGCENCTDLDGDGYGVGDGCLGTDCDEEDDTVHQNGTEYCDGKDNNCDGETDELFPEKGEACDGADPDDCASGIWTCLEDGSALTCIGDEALAEVCDDELDNDCDGDTDCVDTDCDGAVCGEYGQTCSGGQCACASDTEVCTNSTDDDCDGFADCEDDDCAGQSCGDNGATCSEGNCVCPTGDTEICDNTTDDDCDGSTDCADSDCDGAVCGEYGQTCSGGQCACASDTEVCTNSTDDDCDGFADCEDDDCNGQSCGDNGLACSGGACVCPTGDTEICDNSTDDDCDGFTDLDDSDCSCNEYLPTAAGSIENLNSGVTCSETNLLTENGSKAYIAHERDTDGQIDVSGEYVAACLRADFGQVIAAEQIVVKAHSSDMDNYCGVDGATCNCEPTGMKIFYSAADTASPSNDQFTFVVATPWLDNDVLADHWFAINAPARHVLVCRPAKMHLLGDIAVDVIRLSCNANAPGTSSEQVCFDGVDNDLDDATDCLDDDCVGDACGDNGYICANSECVCPDGDAEICDNDADDDCNGLIDCLDAACDGLACDSYGRLCSSNSCDCPFGTTESNCSDGIDNDCDGNTDEADSECGATCVGVAEECVDNSECAGCPDDNVLCLSDGYIKCCYRPGVTVRCR